MKLITEINESIEYIVEEKNGKKSMHINGVFMMGETKNDESFEGETAI